MDVELDDTVQDDTREAEEVGCLRLLCLFYSCFNSHFLMEDYVISFLDVFELTFDSFV